MATARGTGPVTEEGKKHCRCKPSAADARTITLVNLSTYPANCASLSSEPWRPMSAPYVLKRGYHQATDSHRDYPRPSDSVRLTDHPTAAQQSRRHPSRGDENLEHLQMVLLSLGAWLTELELALADAPKAIVLAACFLPIILAIISRRAFVFLGSVLLASIAFLVVVQPSSIAATIEIGAYVGSIIIALLGIYARRKDAAIHAELTNLRVEVNRLHDAEQRRFISQLNAGDKKQSQGDEPAGSAS